MKRISIAAAGCALLAAAVVCGSPTASASAAERADAAARCLWAKRDCYPPARLWYRVRVTVKATRSHAGLEGGRQTTYDAAQTWELRSDHAVRLTLGCVDLSELRDPRGEPPRRPFLVKRRINGKRRTIGGCGSESDDLKPSVRFKAAASGLVDSSTVDNTWAEWADGNGNSCSSKDEHQALTESQELRGEISSASSLAEGLMLWAEPAGPGSNVHIDWSQSSCNFRGQVTNSPAHGADRRFGPVELLGGDPRRVFYDGDWRPVWKFIRFPVRAGNFGRDYAVHRVVGQAQLEPGSFPPPPSGSQADWLEWSFAYNIQLEACPRNGLDVEHC